ncbi:MAG: outer membrane beta-barrel protein [Pseudomonadota bacterium]
MLKYLASAAAIGALIAPAAAGNFLVSPRFEAVYANIDFDDGGAQVDALGGRFGLDIAKFFGVEAEVFTGISDPDGLELDYKAGVFGVARYPIVPTFSLYGRAGLVQAEYSIGSVSVEETGYSVGAGVRLNVPATPFAARAGYDRTDYGDGAEANELSLAVIVKF